MHGDAERRRRRRGRVLRLGLRTARSAARRLQLGAHRSPLRQRSRRRGPEWQLLDGAYAVGRKVAAYTPDGGGASIPWLLLAVTSTGGNGAFSRTTYVQRLDTAGGNAPSTGCDQGATGTTQKVPYSADYYFYGP